MRQQKEIEAKFFLAVNLLFTFHIATQLFSQTLTFPESFLFFFFSTRKKGRRKKKTSAGLIYQARHLTTHFWGTWPQNEFTQALLQLSKFLGCEIYVYILGYLKTVCKQIRIFSRHKAGSLDIQKTVWLHTLICMFTCRRQGGKVVRQSLQVQFLEMPCVVSTCSWARRWTLGCSVAASHSGLEYQLRCQLIGFPSHIFVKNTSYGVQHKRKSNFNYH